MFRTALTHIPRQPCDVIPEVQSPSKQRPVPRLAHGLDRVLFKYVVLRYFPLINLTFVCCR